MIHCMAVPPDVRRRMTESLPLPSGIVDCYRRVTVPGSVFAVRVTDCHDFKRQELFELSGYFNSPDIAARLVGKARKLHPSQCLMTVNPVRPELLRGTSFELDKNVAWTLTDNDILEYRNLVIAVDRGKPEDIENCKVFIRKQNPLTGTIELRLAELSWPLSMRLWTPASKLLIYPIRLPNDPTSRELVQSVLV